MSFLIPDRKAGFGVSRPQRFPVQSQNNAISPKNPQTHQIPRFFPKGCRNSQSRDKFPKSGNPVPRRNHSIHSIIDCSCHVYIVVLRAHSVRGESRIQRNASGEVAPIQHRGVLR